MEPMYLISYDTSLGTDASVLKQMCGANEECVYVIGSSGNPATDNARPVEYMRCSAVAHSLHKLRPGCTQRRR